jgi:hypothetical protein
MENHTEDQQFQQAGTGLPSQVTGTTSLLTMYPASFMQKYAPEMRSMKVMSPSEILERWPVSELPYLPLRD